VNKGVGFCYVCELKIFGTKGLLKWWPELRGHRRTAQPEATQGQPTALANPRGQSISAWDDEEPRNYLIGRNIEEDLCRKLNIMWVPSESAMAMMMTSISPEFRPAPWIRKIRSADSKWRPGGNDIKAYCYGFGIQYLREGANTVVLTEGIFDILSSGLLGMAIALLGAAAREVWADWLLNVRGLENVVLWFDEDVKGAKADKAIKEMLMDVWGLNVMSLRTVKDPKHYWGRGESVVREFLSGFDNNENFIL
jgi:hypothetical protein